jgi:hypothetical protein
MRHLIGVALAIVLAAAVFFAGSWGYLKLLSVSAKGAVPAGDGSLIHDHAVLEGFGVLLALGLLAGVLMVLPMVSPLAAGLPGLALLAWTGLYLFDVRRAVRYIPLKSQTYGTGFEALLFDGLLALAGLALIIPLFVPSRWRRRPAVAEPAPFEAAPGAYQDQGATQTIASGGLLADWAETSPQPRVEPGGAQAPWAPADPAGPGATGSPPDYN